MHMHHLDTPAASEKRTQFLEHINQLANDKAALNPEGFKGQLICKYQLELLSRLETALNAENPSEVLKKELAQNWKLVKGTFLSYTSMPEDDVTTLLCDIAESISDEENHPFKILIPGVNPDSAKEEYPDLAEKGSPSLKTILRTHILSQFGNSLVPVRTLGDLTPPFDKAKLPNYYYDVFSAKADDKGFLTQNDLERLYSHTNDTQALRDCTQNYLGHLTDDNTLLGKLNILISGLHLYDVGGLGREEDAGGGAYDYIIKFRDYYSLLDDEQKKQIPQKVRDEIELLLDLAFDPEKNKNAVEDLRTCIATRKGKLSGEVKVNETALSQIKIGGQTSQSLLEGTKQAFETARDNLKQSIADNKYQGGADRLGVTAALLRELKFELRISTEAEFVDFMSSSPSELQDIIKTNPKLKQDILNHLKDLETLVISCTETSPERLKAVFEVMGKEIFDKHIKRVNDISACLSVHEGEKLDAVIFGLKDKLPEFIKYSWDFGDALQYLSPEQRTEVYNALKDKLPEIIKSGSDFKFALQHLNPEQCTEVYNALKNKLPGIIKNGANFGSALEHLSPEQRTEVYNSLKDKLPEIIKNGTDFGYALEHLSPEQRTEVYNTLKDKVPKIIKNATDFGSALKHLSPEQRTEVYNTLKDNVPEIIKYGTDFGSVLRYLNPGQCTAVCKALKDKLPEIIKDGYDFGVMLMSLNPDQCTTVCDTLKDKVPEVIKSGRNFGLAHQLFNPEQCTAVCKALKDKLPEIIKDGHDFIFALKALKKPESQKPFLDAFKEVMLKPDKDVEKFVEKMKTIHSSEQSTEPSNTLVLDLYFKSCLKAELLDDESKQELAAFDCGKKAEKSLRGSFAAFANLDFYRKHDAFCAGKEKEAIRAKTRQNRNR